MEKSKKNGIKILVSIVIIVMLIALAILLGYSSSDQLTIRDYEEAEVGDWLEGWCYLKDGGFSDDIGGGVLFLVDTPQAAEVKILTQSHVRAPVMIQENLTEELEHQNYFYMKAKKKDYTGDTPFLMASEIYDENMVLIYESWGPF